MTAIIASPRVQDERDIARGDTRRQDRGLGVRHEQVDDELAGFLATVDADDRRLAELRRTVHRRPRLAPGVATTRT